MDEKNAELLRGRSRAAFDAQAATYDEGMEGDHARRLYQHVVGEVTCAVAGMPAPRVLDLGCGTGALAARLLDAIPGCSLTGVDLSQRMVEVARARWRDEPTSFSATRSACPSTTPRLTWWSATTRSTTTRTRRGPRSRRGGCSRREALS